MIDRLTLTHERLAAIIEGVRQVISLDDPVGEVLGMKERPNGLLIGQKRVPMGVIGMTTKPGPMSPWMPLPSVLKRAMP